MPSDMEIMLALFQVDCERTLRHGSWNDLAHLAAMRDKLAEMTEGSKKSIGYNLQNIGTLLPLYRVHCSNAEIYKNINDAWFKGPQHPKWLWVLTWISCFARPWELKREWPLSELSDDDLPLALTFFLQTPAGWQHLGDADKYVQYFECILAELGTYASSTSKTRQHIIDQILLKKLDISLALFGHKNLRTLTRARAQLLQDVLRRTYTEVPLELTSSSTVTKQVKKRLGIIIRYFKPFIDNFMLAGFLADLPRDRYEVTLYSVQDIERRIDPTTPENSEFRKQFMSLIDHYVALDEIPLPETINIIRKDQQDIILFGNTMHISTAKAHLLHAYRLAPTQIVTTITTCSSGFDNTDYYISAGCTEPPDAENHYSEKLILMPEWFYALAFDPAPSAVAQFLASSSSTDWFNTLHIPDSSPLLVSGAGWPKLTPETLNVWMEILHEMPDSHLVLYPDSPSWRGDWFAEAQKSLISDCLKNYAINPQRCHIVKPPSYNDILQLASRATLYLDAFPYSGNMSLREPLLLNCPVITCETTHQRGMQGSAVLRSLGLDILVASDSASYREKVVSLLKNKGAINSLRSQIHNAMQHAPFYDTRSVSKAFTDILDGL